VEHAFKACTEAASLKGHGFTGCGKTLVCDYFVSGPRRQSCRKVLKIHLALALSQVSEVAKNFFNSASGVPMSALVCGVILSGALAHNIFDSARFQPRLVRKRKRPDSLGTRLFVKQTKGEPALTTDNCS